MKYLKSFNESNQYDLVVDIVAPYLHMLEDELDYHKAGDSFSDYNIQASNNISVYNFFKYKSPHSMASLSLLSTMDKVDKTIEIINQMEKELIRNDIKLKSNLNDDDRHIDLRQFKVVDPSILEQRTYKIYIYL